MARALAARSTHCATYFSARLHGSVQPAVLCDIAAFSSVSAVRLNLIFVHHPLLVSAGRHRHHHYPQDIYRDVHCHFQAPHGPQAVGRAHHGTPGHCVEHRRRELAESSQGSGLGGQENERDEVIQGTMIIARFIVGGYPDFEQVEVFPILSC